MSDLETQESATEEPVVYNDIKEAARAWAEKARAKREEAEALAESTGATLHEPEAKEAEPSSPEMEETAPETPEETQHSSNDQVEPEPEEALPSLEPPRSWTSEDKELFYTLAPETQGRLVELDRTRELEVRRGQNETAEQRKALDAERQAMETARQQYEQSLPVLLQSLQSSADFSDIRSQEDVDALAQTDPSRWVAYQNHVQKVQAIQQELVQAQQRQSQEAAQEWQNFALEQDKLFVEKNADAREIQPKAVNYLRSQGFDDAEISEYWNTAAWRDHRMQSVIRDALKFREGLRKVQQAPKKAPPPVQQPGNIAPPPSKYEGAIKQLEGKASLTIKEAARLSQLRKAHAAEHQKS